MTDRSRVDVEKTVVVSSTQCECGETLVVENRPAHNGLHLLHGQSVLFFEDWVTAADGTGLTDEMQRWLTESAHGG